MLFWYHEKRRATVWLHNEKWLFLAPMKQVYLYQYIVDRGILIPLFYEDSLPPILSTLFFQILSKSPYLSCCLQPPTPQLFLLSCFFGWMGDRATFDVLFYLMILWYTHARSWYFSTRRALMCVLCNNVSSLLRFDT